VKNFGAPRVLGDLLADRVKRNANKIFLRFKEERITYDELDRFSNRCANAFLDLGIAKGDKVSIMLPNCPDFIYIWFGLAKIGAVEVPVNTNYKDEFLRHIIDQSDSRILLIDGQYLDRLKIIEHDLKKLEKVIVLGDLESQKSREIRIPIISYDDFFNHSDDPVDIKVHPWDPISIVYTSGTTGLSKGALGPHKFWILVIFGLLLLKRYLTIETAVKMIYSTPSCRSIISTPKYSPPLRRLWPKPRWCFRTVSVLPVSGMKFAPVVPLSSIIWVP